MTTMGFGSAACDPMQRSCPQPETLPALFLGPKLERASRYNMQPHPIELRHIGLTINCLGVFQAAELTLTCNGCKLGQQGYLEGGGDLVSRSITGIIKVRIWDTGIINLLTKPP